MTDFRRWPEPAQRRLLLAVLSPRQPSRWQRWRERIGRIVWLICTLGEAGRQW